MGQIIRMVLSGLGVGLQGLGRWVAANLKYAVGLLALVVGLMILWRLFLPATVFASVRATLIDKGGYSPAVAGFLGLVGAAIIIATTGALAAWIVLGRRPEAAAMAVMALAVVVFVPAMIPFTANFDSAGKPLRWYSLNAETGQIALHDTGRSRETGQPNQALTTDVATEYQRQHGRAPQVILTPICQIEYFNAGSGLPQVWVSGGNGGVRLFDGPGHDPWTAERLSPVTPAMVAQWVRNC